MSVPCNRSDFRRFQQLAKALSALNPPAEIEIRTSATGKDNSTRFVRLELTGYLNTDTVFESFGVETSPADDPQAQQDATSDAVGTTEHEAEQE